MQTEIHQPPLADSPSSKGYTEMENDIDFINKFDLQLDLGLPKALIGEKEANRH